MLKELVRANQKISAEKLIAPGNTPKFPLQTLDSFQTFDQSLDQEDNSGLRDYLVRRLAALGGSDLRGLTRRILAFLITNEVGISYNWKGRDKLPFNKTNAMKVIYEAANLTFPSNGKSDHVVENAVKDWLKFCKYRSLQALKKNDKMSNI